MIRINLLPDEYKKKAALRRRVMLLAGAGILLVAGFAGVFIMRTARLAELNRMIREVERDLAQLRPVVERVDAISSSKAELNKKIRIIGELMETRVFYPVLMEDLARIFPERVWLKSFSSSGSYDNMRLDLSLEAHDNYAVADFLNALESSRRFSGISFSGIVTEPYNDTYIRIFTVRCVYSPSGGSKEDL